VRPESAELQCNRVVANCRGEILPFSRALNEKP